MLVERSMIAPAVAGLLAVVTWGWLQVTTPTIDSPLAVEKHSANYYSVGYKKQEMDEFGLLKSEVKADKMMHFGDDGSVNLVNPELSFFKKNQPPWVIRAESGSLTSSKKEFWLKGKVLVSRAASSGSRAVAINTSDLRVEPEINFAETDQWAELSSPPSVTSGVGLKLYYSDPIRMTLLHNVRGKYVFD